MRLYTSVERWPLAAAFRITGREVSDLFVLVVRVQEDGFEGRGEAAGVYHRNETAESLRAQVEALRERIERGLDREALQRLLPAGGARNALDCALWELDSRRLGQPVWRLAGLPRAPRPLTTLYTLGAEAPEHMAKRAIAFAQAKALKLKLTGEEIDAERVRSVRAARPDAWLGVDANQGLTVRSLERLLPALVDAKVKFIEQPFPVDRDSDLDCVDSPIPLIADESAQDAGDLPALVGRFSGVNIKLDKCGGLTAALAMSRAAQRAGLRRMVGNMLGTSLAMAPAFVIGQLCDFVDLDGPLLLRADRADTADYTDGRIWCPERLWGGAGADAQTTMDATC